MSEHGSPRHQRAQAKQDPTEWHGQRIVTETDLGAVFTEDDDDRHRRVSMRKVFHGVVLILLVGLVSAAVYVALGVARGDISTGAPEPVPEPTSTCPAWPAASSVSPPRSPTTRPRSRSSPTSEGARCGCPRTAARCITRAWPTVPTTSSR